MSNPPSDPDPFSAIGKSWLCPLSLVELTVVLEELDRVVGELEESLAELALPFDEPSHRAARAAIAAARRGA